MYHMVHDIRKHRFSGGYLMRSQEAREALAETAGLVARAQVWLRMLEGVVPERDEDYIEVFGGNDPVVQLLGNIQIAGREQLESVRETLLDAAELAGRGGFGPSDP